MYRGEVIYNPSGSFLSSFMWLAWCLFLSLLRTRLVNGTVFFRAKRIIVLVFVPVGFFIFFLPPESKVFNRQSGLFSEKRRAFDECFNVGFLISKNGVS